MESISGKMDEALAANPEFLYINDWNEWTEENIIGLRWYYAVVGKR